MKVSPEMDLILWQLAESNDPAALSRFEMTHPGLKAELASRVAAVEGLRNSRPIPPATVPPFHLVPLAPVVPFGWIAMSLIGALVIGTASFFATREFLNAPQEPVIVASNLEPEPQPAVVQPPVEQPVTEAPVEESANGPSADQPYDPRQDVPSLPGGVSAEPAKQDGSTLDMLKDTRPDQKAEGAASSMKKIDIKEKKLSEVIEAFGKAMKLKVEFAPGFQDKVVSAKLEGTSPMQVLTQLGKQNGFTPFAYESEGTLLIIPAVDQG